MKKYNKNQLLINLQRLEDELILLGILTKVNLGIFGGSSLMLKNISERDVTKDIDAILINDFKQDGTRISDLNKLISNTSLRGIINSDAFFFPHISMLEYEVKWELVFTGKNEMLFAYVPSNEMIAAIKIISYAERGRSIDYDDSISRELLRSVDPNNVKEIIDEYKTYIAESKHKIIDEEYELWKSVYNKIND